MYDELAQFKLEKNYSERFANEVDNDEKEIEENGEEKKWKVVDSLRTSSQLISLTSVKAYKLNVRLHFNLLISHINFGP